MANERDDKKDDATPRTDAAEYAGRVMASFARQLERELAIAKKRLWIELEAPTTIGTQSATGACCPVAAHGYDRCRYYFEAEERGDIRRTDSRTTDV